MITQDQLNRLISENSGLQAQVDELNLILSQREEAISSLRENEAMVSELQSRVDMQLEEFYSMQNQLGVKEFQAEGALERELELHQELTEAAGLQQEYNNLVQQHTYLQTQYMDIQEQFLALQKKMRLLEQIAGKTGELESHLANTIMERDELASRLEGFDDKRISQDITDKE